MVLSLCLLQYDFNMSFVEDLFGLFPFAKHSTTSTKRIHQSEVLAFHWRLVLDVDVSVIERLKELILELFCFLGLLELNRLRPLFAHLLIGSATSATASVAS